MNLGERLKAQIAEREQIQVNRQKAKEEAALAKFIREEDEIRNFNRKVIESISNSIDANLPLAIHRRPPEHLFPTHGFKQDKDGMPEGHPHSQAVYELRSWGVSNGLDIRYVYQYDGMGWESWIEISVKPL